VSATTGTAITVTPALITQTGITQIEIALGLIPYTPYSSLSAIDYDWSA
jgi:hypothetical protein